ncbi:MAG: glycosyltransferase family 39 protein [Elusimicrobia bacterium]|nr:glycosyltransferase family 39 protein [Elusimicrobiota bacterium]
MSQKRTLLLIVLLGAALRFWGMDYGLPHLYQTEEYKTIHFALKMGTGDLNPHFFEHPSLYMYFMAFLYGCLYLLGWLLGIYQNTQDFAVAFVRDPTAIYLLSRGVEAFWGLGTVLVGYRIAERVYGVKAARWAAIWLATAPFLVLPSQFVKGIAPTQFLLSVYLYGCIRIAQEGRPRDTLWSGLVLGAACSVRYLAAPMVVLLPWAHWRFSRRKESLRRKPWAWPHLWKGLLLVPITFFLGTPYALLDGTSFLRDLKEAAGPWIPQEAAWGDYGRLAFSLIALPVWKYHAAWMGAWGLFSLGRQVLSRHWAAGLWGIPCLLYYVLVAWAHPFHAGYLFPLYPLLVLAGAGQMGEWTQRPRGRLRKTALLFGILTVLGNLTVCALMSYELSQPDTRTLSKEWIEKNIPPETKILIGNYVNSPPLLKTKDQLEGLHREAVRRESYKKEYLRFQVLAHPGAGHGYELYEIAVDPRSLGTSPYWASQAHRMRNSISIAGGLRDLRRAGIRYVVLNSYDQRGALSGEDPSLGRFYRQVEKEWKLVKAWTPGSWTLGSWTPGPTIWIYRVP